MKERFLSFLRKAKLLTKRITGINNEQPITRPIPSPARHYIGSYVYEELKTILNGQKLNFVDVGGAVNLQPHYDKIIGNANFYVFEPHEQSYLDLVKTKDRYSHPEDFYYINKALAGTNGKRILYISNVPTGTSILKLKKDQLYYSGDHPYFFPMRELEIETHTLKSVLDENNISYFDAIKLDVQGAELEILKGTDGARFDEINVIEMEIGWHDLYENQTKFCEVVAYLESKGFGLFDLRTNRGIFPNMTDNFSYPEKYFNTHDKSPSISSRLWEFDAIFFRETHWVINSNIAKSRILRLISLYCVYNFFAEAIQVLNKALDQGKFTQQEYLMAKDAVIKWNKKEQEKLTDYDRILQQTNYTVWGQYTWAAYPCY